MLCDSTLADDDCVDGVDDDDYDDDYDYDDDSLVLIAMMMMMMMLGSHTSARPPAGVSLARCGNRIMH